VCGRFVVFSNLETLQTHFHIDHVETEVSASYNVAPTQQVLSVIRTDDQNVLVRLHWGLVPFWAKDPAIGNRLINARAETVDSKPSFRAAFGKRRCLVVADGFYEWQGEKGHKKPVYITLPEDEPMGFAGLWEIWDDKGRADEPLRSCTILTTDASPSIRDIHDRMPVILKAGTYRDWLDPQRPDPDLAQILAHHTHRGFRFWPVTTAVNAVRNNSPELITALS
jgi:putative SOS response-associated peptidase YedK